jgi:hypothetical protein
MSTSGSRKAPSFRGAGNKIVDMIQDFVSEGDRAIRDIKSKVDKRNKKKNPFTKKQIDIGGQQASVIKFNRARGIYNFNSNGSEFVIERTEPVLAIVAASGAGDFRMQQIKVLPMGPFAWLGNMANAFTSYQIHRMEFTYIPSVPTTSTGAISLSFQEDYRDDEPASIEAMLLSEQSLYSPVYGGTDGGRYLQQFGAPEGNVVSFEVPSHALKTGSDYRSFKITKGVNFDALLAAANEASYAATREYSPGRVWIGTKGAAASQALGQIFCRYRVKLCGAIAFGLNQ